MNHRSLAFRLAVWYTLLLSATFTLVGAGISYGLEQYLRANLRDSLHVSRANRFVEELPGDAGARFTTAELPIHTDDEIADVVACLLHAGSRDALFLLHGPRVEQDTESSEHDRKAGMVLERFILEKR